MFKEEAMVIGHIFGELGDKCSPVLNIGSSDLHFRKEVQPHIHEYIFKPLLEKGIEVVHADMKEEDGVDLVGNLNDPAFISQLTMRRFNSILCSNLLEHVENPGQLCGIMQQIVNPGGYLVVTVPRLYPYHADPIDTKFRPTLAELSSLFPLCKVRYERYITVNECHFRQLVHHPKQFFLTAKNWIIPRYGFHVWRKSLQDVPHLFHRFRVSCVVLEKI